MKNKSSKIYKPSTYIKKIRDLCSIIAIQEKTVAAKDSRIKAIKEANMIVEAGYDVYKKYSDELKTDYNELLTLHKKIRHKYTKLAVKYNLKLEKIEELTNNFHESDARCEELADENLRHTDLIEELRSEIDLQKEELEQKEQLTEGEYEEEKPN
jgi:chromosome segregation ATPase